MIGALDMALGALNKWVVSWLIAVFVASLSMLAAWGVSLEGRAEETYHSPDTVVKETRMKAWDIGV